MEMIEQRRWLWKESRRGKKERKHEGQKTIKRWQQNPLTMVLNANLEFVRREHFTIKGGHRAAGQEALEEHKVRLNQV